LTRTTRTARSAPFSGDDNFIQGSPDALREVLDEDDRGGGTCEILSPGRLQAILESTSAEPQLEVRGANYTRVLGSLHDELRPSRYLEIGTLTGGTLQLASCASIAIDPRFQIDAEVIGEKPELHLYQETSDDFFALRDSSEVLGGPIDLVFLDGMHLFEFVLRDFMNIEKCCRPNSIIAIHDCVPSDPYMAVRSSSDPLRQRSSHPEWWTGDVWKLIPVLRQHRPTLGIQVLDSQPTGLVVITNLDPDSNTLELQYESILKSWQDMGLDEYTMSRFSKDCDLQSADDLIFADTLKSRFRLSESS